MKGKQIPTNGMIKKAQFVLTNSYLEFSEKVKKKKDVKSTKTTAVLTCLRLAVFPEKPRNLATNLTVIVSV